MFNNIGGKIKGLAIVYFIFNLVKMIVSEIFLLQIGSTLLPLGDMILFLIYNLSPELAWKLISLSMSVPSLGTLFDTSSGIIPGLINCVISLIPVFITSWLLYGFGTLIKRTQEKAIDESQKRKALERDTKNCLYKKN